MKKKTTFKRIDKNTGIESEIHVATAAEPIKDRAIIEVIKTALNTKRHVNITLSFVQELILLLEYLTYLN